jgi:hypothetical protein
MTKVYAVFDVNNDFMLVDSKEKALNACIDIINSGGIPDENGNIDLTENQKLIDEMIQRYKDGEGIYSQDICFVEEKEIF